MPPQVGGPQGPIDFPSLAAALLDRAHALVPAWLPRGAERQGRWYVGDFDGGDGESANVNLHTGQWIDNAAPDEDRGGDLISLYARIRGLNNGQAARELMRDLGWQRTAVVPVHATPPPPAPAPQRRSTWRAIVPVPENAPAPDFTWAYRDRHADAWVRLQAVRTWAYRLDGQLLGYVARFERVDSGGEIQKETLPLTWCVDESDSRGLQRWHWKTWESPRPLYVPAGRLRADAPVLVVEGEKCADAAHDAVGEAFDVVAWPGGCKTWTFAQWELLRGRFVVLWPDVDAQRERLTKVERESGVDRAGKPLLAADRQPGMAAMRGLGTRLVRELGCTVRLCRVPAPGEVPDGWDVADAIAEGWDGERVGEFLRSADDFVADVDLADAVGSKQTPALAGAGHGGSGQGGRGNHGGNGSVDGADAPHWAACLLRSAKGAVQPVRDNVVIALDGLTTEAGRVVRGVDEAHGLIAFNEFTNDVIKTRPSPWGTSAGPWDEVDELEMGHWLTREHGLPSMPRGTLEESVAMVAKRHRYHPVRIELEALRGAWDGTKRLAGWLQRCCVADALPQGDPQGQYLARVGTWLVMAICARVLRPGCKFDYMTIFEGAQGVGKSTLARLLGGEFFADTGLTLGEKDSYQNLQGVLVYEWGELDSLTRAEVTKVKQFISSQKDRFRASFDRRAKDYPRQCVFIGTTNEDHYLVDPTGNRRMWPVRVTRRVDVEWFAAHRSQLFAEALVYLDAGERMHPTPQEQRELFEPQQQQRQIDNAIQSACMRYLYDDDQRVGLQGENGSLVKEITVQDLLVRIGIAVEKQTHVVVRQATSALRHAGWELFRSTRGDRPRMFRRPAVRADEPAAGDVWGGATQRQDSEGRDGCPF